MIRFKLIFNAYCVLAISLGFVFFAYSSDLNDSLINKFELIYKNLAPGDPQRVAISLRLADLLSEKARRVGQLEFNQTGAFGKQSEELREKALKIYESTLPSLEGSQKSRVLLQMGYLSELVQDSKRAQKYFAEVSSTTSDLKLKGEAYLALADNLFRSKYYLEALDAYNKSLSYPVERKGYAQFRKAWSHYHLGNVSQAVAELQTLISTPDFLRPVQSSSNADIDLDFLNEVAQDAATFLARRGNLTLKDLDSFYKSLTKVNAIEHIRHLGYESQRLGQMTDVLTVWNFIYSIAESPVTRAEAQSFLAEAYLATGQKELAVKALKISLDEWSGVPGGCLDSICVEIQKKNRNLVVNWHKSEKISPTELLFQAYESYCGVHSSDLEMAEWKAQILNALGRHKEAYKEYFTLSLKQPDSEGRERLLLLGLDLAERLSSAEIKQEARVAYLTHSILKKQKWPVTYQINKHFYDIKNFDEARSRIQQFAESPDAPYDLRLLSAHLLLDILAEQQQDEEVINKASQYATMFQKNGSEFKKIQNKAALNYVQKLGLQKAEKALAIIEHSIFVDELDHADRVAYLKNQIVLQTHLKNLARARSFVRLLKATPNLTDDDKKWVNAKRLELAEAAFDFEDALVALKEMPSESVEYYLKLALFAEVTEKESSVPYLTKAFEKTSDVELKKVLFFDLLQKSDAPLAWVEKNVAWLQSVDPDSVGRAFVIVYNKSRDLKSLNRALSLTSENSAWLSLIWRYRFLSDFGKQAESLSSMVLNNKTEKSLQKSIKDRIAHLNAIEKIAVAAINKKDWASQVIVLSTLARENKRFFNELMSLPIPDGLTEVESNQYMSLLSKQAEPFQTKANQFSSKASELWANDSWDQDYLTVIKSRPETVELLKLEVSMLSEGELTNSIQARLAKVKDALSDQINSPRSPSLVTNGSDLTQRLNELRSQVKASPFDYQKQIQLIQLERAVGNARLADYLEAKMKLSVEGEKK